MSCQIPPMLCPSSSKFTHLLSGLVSSKLQGILYTSVAYECLVQTRVHTMLEYLSEYYIRCSLLMLFVLSSLSLFLYYGSYWDFQEYCHNSIVRQAVVKAVEVLQGFSRVYFMMLVTALKAVVKGITVFMGVFIDLSIV